MEEILDIYNCKRIKTGKTIKRSECSNLSNDEYILAVQCWVINKQGKILLTQRHWDKGYGGMWEPTGGLVQSGESSIQGITRELQEEIGLHVPENDIHLIKQKIDASKSGKTFRDVYMINKEINLNELHFNDGEVVNAKYVTIEELSDEIEKGNGFEWLGYFIDLYKELKV